ncbi:hypothetical protein [Chitinimonas sp. BJB300]|uniref:hypothetical protein n=1 Tax=Chitinimonas sp. BJB300 TaxID=1559339 RepID=UPI000C11ED4A|nr:hypothetical protein [Chitinimonas sp. BJB300]PHV12547.1 hypothetical protein CSQ89_04985 [Chitinimonas sp. BJB300]TSJ90057.1 hypothetical protein FG002_007685 [Chitinimonas sp. BJB300]
MAKPILIEAVTAQDGAQRVSALITLLTNAVENGASLGFLAPIHHDAAQHYWADVLGITSTMKPEGNLHYVTHPTRRHG